MLLMPILYSVSAMLFLFHVDAVFSYPFFALYPFHLLSQDFIYTLAHSVSYSFIGEVHWMLNKRKINPRFIEMANTKQHFRGQRRITAVHHDCRIPNCKPDGCISLLFMNTKAAVYNHICVLGDRALLFPVLKIRKNPYILLTENYSLETSTNSVCF